MAPPKKLSFGSITNQLGRWNALRVPSLVVVFKLIGLFSSNGFTCFFVVMGFIGNKEPVRGEKNYYYKPGRFSKTEATVTND